eukprot:Selendium_serpulae@DN894_c1_g1_i1.p1
MSSAGVDATQTATPKDAPQTPGSAMPQAATVSPPEKLAAKPRPVPATTPSTRQEAMELLSRPSAGGGKRASCDAGRVKQASANRLDLGGLVLQGRRSSVQAPRSNPFDLPANIGMRRGSASVRNRPEPISIPGTTYFDEETRKAHIEELLKEESSKPELSPQTKGAPNFPLSAAMDNAPPANKYVMCDVFGCPKAEIDGESHKEHSAETDAAKPEFTDGNFLEWKPLKGDDPAAKPDAKGVEYGGWGGQPRSVEW